MCPYGLRQQGRDAQAPSSGCNSLGFLPFLVDALTSLPRHQTKVAAFARTEHQSVCPEAHRLTEAIDSFVKDFERGHR